MWHRNGIKIRLKVAQKIKMLTYTFVYTYVMYMMYI